MLYNILRSLYPVIYSTRHLDGDNSRYEVCRGNPGDQILLNPKLHHMIAFVGLMCVEIKGSWDTSTAKTWNFDYFNRSFHKSTCNGMEDDNFSDQVEALKNLVIDKKNAQKDFDRKQYLAKYLYKECGGISDPNRGSVDIVNLNYLTKKAKLSKPNAGPQSSLSFDDEQARQNEKNKAPEETGEDSPSDTISAPPEKRRKIVTRSGNSSQSTNSKKSTASKATRKTRSNNKQKGSKSKTNSSNVDEEDSINNDKTRLTGEYQFKTNISDVLSSVDQTFGNAHIDHCGIEVTLPERLEEPVEDIKALLPNDFSQFLGHLRKNPSVSYHHVLSAMQPATYSDVQKFNHAFVSGRESEVKWRSSGNYHPTPLELKGWNTRKFPRDFDVLRDNLADSSEGDDEDNSEESDDEKKTSVNNQQDEEKSTEQQQTEENSAERQQNDENSTEQQQTDEKSAEEQQTEENSTDLQQTDENSARHQQTGGDSAEQQENNENMEI